MWTAPWNAQIKWNVRLWKRRLFPCGFQSFSWPIGKVMYQLARK